MAIVRVSTVEDDDIGVAEDQIALIWWLGQKQGTRVTLKNGKEIIVNCDAGDLMTAINATVVLPPSIE